MWNGNIAHKLDKLKSEYKAKYHRVPHGKFIPRYNNENFSCRARNNRRPSNR